MIVAKFHSMPLPSCFPFTYVTTDNVSHPILRFYRKISCLFKFLNVVVFACQNRSITAV